MFHRSPRLLLRPVWPEDWKAVFHGISDEGIVRNLAKAPWPYREDDARAFVSLPVDPIFPRFLIVRACDASLVGCVGLDPHGEEVELGYWIVRAQWGQGYATEAGLSVIEIARVLGHHRLTASHFFDNPASCKVLIKLGFEPTGRIVDRYSCGRDGFARAAEYALDLAGANASMTRAAA